MIQGLLEEKPLQLFAYCSKDTGTLHGRPAASSQLCTLEITVYGPGELFDLIGSWFQEYSIYLQDPTRCDLDVMYYNPHRMSSSNRLLCPHVSQVVLMGSSLVQFHEIDEKPDLLDIISGQEELEEMMTPKVIRAELHKWVLVRSYKELSLRSDLGIKSKH